MHQHDWERVWVSACAFKWGSIDWRVFVSHGGLLQFGGLWQCKDGPEIWWVLGAIWVQSKNQPLQMAAKMGESTALHCRRAMSSNTRWLGLFREQATLSSQRSYREYLAKGLLSNVMIYSWIIFTTMCLFARWRTTCCYICRRNWSTSTALLEEAWAIGSGMSQIWGDWRGTKEHVPHYPSRMQLPPVAACK